MMHEIRRRSFSCWYVSLVAGKMLLDQKMCSVGRKRVVFEEVLIFVAGDAH